jgi:hypothetical protein
MENTTTTQHESPGRRAATYWFVDGLPEIVFGLPLFLLGAFGVTISALQWEKTWRVKLVAMLLSLFWLTIWSRYRQILDALKARITYPRTGYVSPPTDVSPAQESNIIVLNLGSASPVNKNVTSFHIRISYLFFGGYVFIDSLRSLSLLKTSWSLPLIMTIIAAALYFGDRREMGRFSWHKLLPIALSGFLAVWMNLRPEACACVPLLVGGAWLLSIGIPALVGYLRLNPKLDTPQGNH